MAYVNVVLTALFSLPAGNVKGSSSPQTFPDLQYCPSQEMPVPDPIASESPRLAETAAERRPTVCFTEGWNTDSPKREGYLIFIVILCYCVLLPFLRNCKLMSRAVLGNGNTFVTGVYTVSSIGKVGGGFLMWELLFNNRDKNCIGARRQFYIPFH